MTFDHLRAAVLHGPIRNTSSLFGNHITGRRLHDDLDLGQYGVGLGRPHFGRAGHLAHALHDERLPLLVHAFSIRQVDVDLFLFFFHELEERYLIGNELFLLLR